MVGGFNVVDFMDLPAVERSLLRLILRKVELTYPQLLEAMASMPPDQQMNQARLDAALDHLISQHWLVCQGRGQQIVYHVNANSRSTQSNQAFWDSLELEKMQQPRTPVLDCEPPGDPLLMRRGKRVLPDQIWDRLTEPTSDEAKSEPRPAPRRANLFDKLSDNPAKDS